jgi:hypothetical protein
MYQMDFIAVQRSEAEKLWRTVEDRMPEVYLAIENGTIDHDPAAAKALKDCIALHFIRSETMKGVADRSNAAAIAQMRQTLASEPQRIADEYLGETGIKIETPQELSYVIDRIMAPIEVVLSSADEFVERVKVHFNDVKNWCSGLELEILSPENADDEFLIGDTPCLSYKPGSLLGGPLAGVPLGEAAAVYMPIDPKYIASLARKGGWHRIASEQVGQINHMQALNAKRQLCARPGMGPIARHVVAA